MEIRLGMNATVLGDGPTGLFYVQLLKKAGTGKIRLVGMRENRLELGRRLGADETTNLRTQTLQSLAETQDIVIEAAGTEASLQSGIQLLKKGGQLLLFGLPGQPIVTDIQSVVLKELRLYGSTNAPGVWPRVIEMIASGGVKVYPLITHRYAFDELDKAVETARSQSDEAIKIIVHNP
ncbi:zinc-binding dehydrogenase [Cohnella herbarum]|uniref:Zinc-binding dehydrogenase n=1 Tax=Cohnella herbarum TaxID=2728023 RepID=A0A7Z2VNN9_9BACL|nr:zinc-binding dehydrogenase [Cohnella herbarum]QJD86279.1 zinc-binding dehydrogenase [Cohnella herbarum]